LIGLTEGRDIYLTALIAEGISNNSPTLEIGFAFQSISSMKLRRALLKNTEEKKNKNKGNDHHVRL
jgi:hypothetical protein